MAGIFGFFNFEKEGPGIDKNAPKKKTFIVFFETFFRNFWKFITINFVYSILSVLLIPSGLASAGLTNITRNIARDKHSFGLSDFIDTIRKNWKQALPAGIINTVLYSVMLFAAWFYFNSKGIFATIGLGICLAALFTLSMMSMYIWTLLITFNFTLKQIYKNSYKFAIINLFKNALCLIILALVHAFYILILVLTYNISAKVFIMSIVLLAIIYMLTFPAFKYLLTQYFIFPSIKKYIIDPYYKEHPEADINKRRDLGIEIEGDDEEEDQVFSETVKSEEDDDDDEELVFND